MAAFWLWAYDDEVLGDLLFWLELIAAGGAGYVIGGFVAYGRMGHVLHRLGLKPLIAPGHPDGAGGLRPVGALYFRQAMIVALIGVFAGLWWLLFPVVGRWETWRDPYLAIVLVCLMLEFAALFLPLVFFHRQMSEQRAALLFEADEAARDLVQADTAIWRAKDEEDLGALESRRERARARWETIDSMPPWPIDAGIRRRFAWSNIAILVPVLLEIINAPHILRQISQALSNL